MKQIPTIKSVEALPDYTLHVEFDNGERKAYNCGHLIESELFSQLKDPAQFNMAHPNKHSVVWNEDLDLSESEIWFNGVTIENK
jgi:hypothetical protein